MTDACIMDPLIKDAFLEIANIGIGKSAASMSQLAGKHVAITIPSVDFVRTAERDSFQLMTGSSSTVIVEQRFHGEIAGTAILCLATTGALKLASMLLGEEVRQDAFGEMEQGALLELGNIMIGGLVGNMSNVLHLHIGYDIPEMQLNGTGKVLTLMQSVGACTVVVNSNLAIESTDVSSFLLLVFGELEFESLLNKIRSVM